MILITTKVYDERMKEVEGLMLDEVDECIVYNYECIVETVFDDIDNNTEDEMLCREVLEDIMNLKEERRKLFERKEEILDGE